MSNAEVTTGWTASTYPGGRAAFRKHLKENWTEIQRQTAEAFETDRRSEGFALRQWLAFERDYQDRILVDEAVEAA